jgi:hypothetical protein
MLHVLALAPIFWTATAHAQATATHAPPTAVAPIGPEAPASASDLETLRSELRQVVEANQRRMEAEEAAISRLATQLQLERDARAADAVKALDDARANATRPLVQAGRFNLRLSGFLQFDTVAWSQAAQDQLNPSTGLPLNDTRFLIRRARLRAEVDWRIINGAVEFDGNTNNGYQARIIGAEASLVWRNPTTPLVPWLQLTAGSFKIPFGFEVTQRDTDRLFLERSTMEHAFFPGEYDLGVRLQGGWRFLRYAVAVMNGDPIGEKAFPGRDPNKSKDVLGRLGIEQMLGRFGFSGGVSGLYGTGFHSGTPATKDTLVWRDSNQDGAVQVSEISVIAGSTATPSQNFSRWAVGGDLRLTLDFVPVGQLLLYGELTYASNLDRNVVIADPVTSERSLRELGFYVGATQELTQWGAIGVRYDRYDPDRDANRLRNGVQVPNDLTYSTWAFAAALRYPNYGRLIVEYDHNTNALGRTPAGTPTTLASDTFMIRAEVKF